MAILKYMHKISIIACLCMLSALLCLLSITLSSCSLAGTEDSQVSASSRVFVDESSQNSAAPAAEQLESIELNIVSIGDMIFHYYWMDEYDDAGNQLYPEYFQYTSEISQNADLALCNVEAPIAGGELSGYPLFNVGDSIATAVSNAGYDVVYTSHNHTLDMGGGAVLRTLEVLRAAGLETTGTRLSADEQNFALVEVKGVKIAVIAYTYETADNLINGIPIPAGMDENINSYLYGSDEDLQEMKALIDDSRAAGADLVIFYLHSGIEYQQEPSADQRQTAQFLVDNGVDIIFGSHVHVVQPMEMLQPSDGSAPVPVYWGLGNYISSQVAEGGMSLENEEGNLAKLSITWNPNTNEVDAFTMDYIPLWTCYYYSNDFKYTTIPDLGDVSQNPSVLAANKLDRARAAFAEVRSILGEPLKWQREGSSSQSDEAATEHVQEPAANTPQETTEEQDLSHLGESERL